MVAFPNLHEAGNRGVIAVLLIGYPFQIFWSVVCLIAILVVNSDFPTAIFTGWWIKKGESDQRVDQRRIGLEVVFNDDLKIAAPHKMWGGYFGLSLPADRIRPCQSPDFPNLINLKGKIGIFDSDWFPLHNSTMRMFVAQSIPSGG
jgi:hypothetical protein